MSTLGKGGRVPICTEDALYRLLFHKRYRDEWIAGRGDALGLTDAQLQSLESIDRGEFLRTCQRIVDNLVNGNSGGAGGLRRAFPRLLALLNEHKVPVARLFEDFMESAPFSAYRDIPLYGESLCVEEAFFQYVGGRADLLSLHPAMEVVLTHEFLTAVLSILVVNPDPAFRIESALLLDNGCCRFAVRVLPAAAWDALGLTPPKAGASLYLYAAGRRSYVSGPVPPLVADVMAIGKTAAVHAAQADLGARHSVDSEAVRDVAAGLQSIGLLA